MADPKSSVNIAGYEFKAVFLVDATTGLPYVASGGGGGGGAVTVADGADVTLGAKADAKSTATDTTPVTAMQVLKQISASEQLGSTAANQVLANTKLDTLHTDLTTTNSQLPSSISGTVQATITRPANTTAYTANDVLGGAITFATGATSGQRIMISGADLQPQIGAVPSGMTSFRLYLYDVTPPSAIADNGAWDLSSGDRASFLGYVDLGTPVDLGSTLFVQLDGINKMLKLNGSANLFGYLVTNGGFTPAANSEAYLVRLQIVGF